MEPGDDDPQQRRHYNKNQFHDTVKILVDYGISARAGCAIINSLIKEFSLGIPPVSITKLENLKANLGKKLTTDWQRTVRNLVAMGVDGKKDK